MEDHLSENEVLHLKNMTSLINEELRQKVGLEKLYPYKVKANLITDKGLQAGGWFDPKTEEICLNAHIFRKPKSAVCVYLHEVGHLLARDSTLNTSPGSHEHNPYFAVLVAIMYRRAGLFAFVKIYDFGDTNLGMSSELDFLITDDEELIDRFTYVVRRSAELAKTNLTMEQLARKIHVEDYRYHRQMQIFPIPEKHIPKQNWLKLSACFGGLIFFTAVLGAIAAKLGI